MGQLAVPQIWSRLHDSLIRPPPRVDTVRYIKDDFVGVFNSAPKTAFWIPYMSLVLHSQEKHPDVVLSVDMSQEGNSLQLSYAGKFHKAPRKT